MREGAIAPDLGADGAMDQSVPQAAQPFEVVSASNDPVVVEDTAEVEPVGLQALGYAPEIEAPHGFAEPPPTDPSPFAETVATPLDASLTETAPSEVDPMQAFVDGMKTETNLGDELNRVKKSDTGVTLAEKPEDPRFNTDGLELVPKEEDMVAGINIAGLELVPKEGEPTSPAKAPEANKAKEVAPDIAATYQERFGISKEALESIEGFGDLSAGQQKMVLENLSQLTIGRIREEAIDGHTADIAAEKSKKGFLGKVWVGIRDSVMKKADTVKREKMLAKDMQKGGIAVHKDSLQQLVSGMKNFGPEVVEKNGELEIQLIETKGLSPEVAKVAEVFNEQGNAFSKIPYEWSLDTATPEQQKAFTAAKETYELQRGVLMQHMETAEGKEKAFSAMAKTESTIEMQRFLQTCPDAAKELENIENQNVWTAALKSVGTERGAYMFAGLLTRSALAGAIGLAAAPVTAALMGGAMGWKRAAEGLKQQDKDQRAGKEIPDTAEQKAAKTRIGIINEALAHVDAEDVKASLVAELAELNASLQGTTKNMVESARGADEKDKEGYRGSVEKLDGLVAKIRGEEDSSRDPGKLVAMLERRIEYTEQKMREGKMVFGDKKERLANQYALTNSLMQAKALIAGMTAVDAQGLKTEERLAKMLGKADSEISSERRKHKIKQAVRAGVIGAAFAGVGSAARDLASDDSVIAETWAGITGGAEEMEEPVGAAAAAAAGATEWVESPTGLNVTPEDLNAVQPSGTGLMEPGASSEWVETPGGLRVAPEDIGAVEESATGLVEPTIEAAPGYTVVPGDNLSKIFAHEIPGSTNQEVMRELLKMSPEELKAMGVASGNMNLIHPGDHIDIEKMRALLAAHPGGGAGAATAAAEHATSVTDELNRAPVQEWVDSSTGLRVSPEDVDATTGEDIIPETRPSTSPYEDDAVSPIGQVEGGEFAPERPLGEMSQLEIDNWPHNKPLPWPMNSEEAAEAYGNATSPDRQLAENMRAVIGRYPNENEFEGFKGMQAVHTASARSLLLDMKKSPLTFNRIQEAAEDVAKMYQHEVGQIPPAPMPMGPRAETLQAFAPTLESTVPGNADFDPNGMDRVAAVQASAPSVAQGNVLASARAAAASVAQNSSNPTLRAYTPVIAGHVGVNDAIAAAARAKSPTLGNVLGQLGKKV